MAFGERLSNLRPEDFVYVCRDAGAGGYEAFPDVCRLQDGRLMAVFYAGYGHVSLPDERLPKGGRICYCLSSDEGRTWSEARVLCDGPDDDRDPSLVQLSNGSLICNFFSLRKKEKVKEGEAAWIGLGSWMVVSQDGGKTWGKPVDIDNGGYKLDAETDVIPLKDGSLYAVQREPKTTMCYSVSRDGGRTWSVSRPLGFPGHCPYLLRTPDDIIILAHRLPQTSLHFSLDEAKTWSGNVLVEDVGGAYPSMVNLRDGLVLIVYYEEGEGSDIRVRRFRTTKAGIRWLKFDARTDGRAFSRDI
ncbi:MAG TPA: sialidase family protein [Candidatus Desulfaltia sp.]|nr:sialidase family protein [Candidatus Desulfaltia sp.]